MRAMRVRLEHTSGEAEGTAKQLASLSGMGLHLHVVSPYGVPDGSGVLLTSAPLDDVRIRLRDYGQAGHRAVVVALDDQVLRSSWELLQAGAMDVVPHAEPLVLVASLAARFRRWHEVDQMLDAPLVRDRLSGESPCWRAALRSAIEVARYAQADVLLTGESGTGKELVARLIHTLDRRPDKAQLVVLDCTVVSAELSGSEFFGHVKGAFTNAVAPREGALALADQGTLFLDEVGELPLALQAELLRAIQEKTFKPVGSNVWREVSFRLVCATHRDLEAEVAAGRFRHDLYHRLAAVRLRLPPLRDRPDDIVLLGDRFLRERLGSGATMCGPVRELLAARLYPGNVRELRQLVARIAARHVGDGPVTVGDVPPDEWPQPGETAPFGTNSIFGAAARHALALGMGLKDISTAAGDAAIRLALEAEGGTHGAAERLDVTDRAIQLRMAKWREAAA